MIIVFLRSEAAATFSGKGGYSSRKISHCLRAVLITHPIIVTCARPLALAVIIYGRSHVLAFYIWRQLFELFKCGL